MSPKKRKDEPEMAPPDAGKDPDAPRHAAYGPLDAAREAGQREGPVGVAAAPPREQLPDDPEQLREQIQETRAELGETVEALSEKADVKAHAQAKVEEGKQELRDKQAEVRENPAPYAGALGALVGLMLLVLLLRRRGS